jgi:hypothetical protein
MCLSVRGREEREGELLKSLGERGEREGERRENYERGKFKKEEML